MSLWLPPTRPLTKKKPVVTLAEIAENDVIITNQQFYFSDMSNEYTKNTLAYLIKPRFDLWNPIAAMELAKLDCGIALLASYLVEDAVKKGELCTLNVPELDFTVWLQVLRHEQKAVTPQMSAFYKLLREYYKSEIIRVESKPLLLFLIEIFKSINFTFLFGCVTMTSLP